MIELLLLKWTWGEHRGRHRCHDGDTDLMMLTVVIVITWYHKQWK